LVFLESSFIEYLPHCQTKKLLATVQTQALSPARRQLLGDVSLAERLERLAVNAKVAIVLGSIPASSDKVESEGWQSNVHKNQNVE
jgi:hypothetical protein